MIDQILNVRRMTSQKSDKNNCVMRSQLQSLSCLVAQLKSQRAVISVWLRLGPVAKRNGNMSDLKTPKSNGDVMGLVGTHQPRCKYHFARSILVMR